MQLANTMNAIVIQRLNRRIGSPSVNAPKLSPLEVGTSIDIAQTITGDKVDGNDVWYKTIEGWYVWSGGCEVIGNTENNKGNELFFIGRDYQKLIQGIPDKWFDKNGSCIKVAVLDSGFNLNHPDLQHLKNRAFVQDFGQNGNTTDFSGHGTHVTGLLFAQTRMTDGIKGLIPDAMAYLYKVSKDDIGFIDSFVEAAIEDCIKKEVHIINMSFSVPSSKNSELHSIIQKAIDNNIMVVASAGENKDLIQKNLVYPAQFEKVISVGEADNIFIKALNMPFNSKLDFILPFIEQISCWINDNNGLYKPLKGSSMAAAIITGLLSAIKCSLNNVNPLLELKNTIPNITSINFSDELQITKP
jgi:subtilisin family serine protease